MKNIQVNCRCRKTVTIVLAMAVMLLSMAGSCLAEDYIAVKVYPEHVGVFTTDGVQQFIAFGYTATGNRTNITNKVDWESSNENIVTINENGVATVVTGKTSGQVRISCSYPKTGNAGAAVNHLLLRSTIK
ncbi:MAG: hypothetical protein KKH60_07300 [Proteobacteria bacterium]|nr:hypothetical protein [Pseudomonadota bacterium]MBU1139203.1 hypothetical protein [Pseudomonadota bacterium]